jgi:phage antirepressor YoqD-like protein
MTELILAAQSNSNSSPFDEIRRIDESGNEYWVARELQKALGYKSWGKFQDLIRRVVKSIGLTGQNPSDHIAHEDNMIALGKGATRTVGDYRLSRYACYLIAMSGDNSKPEIAAAQSYFALKTREAETAAPAKLPTAKELAYMLIAAEEAREALEAQIEADSAATALGRIIEESTSQNMRIGDFAKVLGDVGQNEYFDELRLEGIIMPGSTLPYQRYISAGYFRVSQVQGRGKASTKWFAVSLVTPKGQAYLAKRHRKLASDRTTIRTIEAQVSALV